MGLLSESWIPSKSNEYRQIHKVQLISSSRKESLSLRYLELTLIEIPTGLPTTMRIKFDGIAVEKRLRWQPTIGYGARLCLNC